MLLIHTFPVFFSQERLAKSLTEWLQLLKTYETYETKSDDDSDLAYWHGERPLTGLLAAAAWKISGWSLEEFGVRRKGPNSDHATEGRCDLQWGLQESQTTVEAKIAWIDQAKLKTVEGVFSKNWTKPQPNCNL